MEPITQITEIITVLSTTGFDVILIAFIKNNFITILLVLSVLKVIAGATPWATDDKIIELLIGWMKRKTKDN